MKKAENRFQTRRYGSGVCIEKRMVAWYDSIREEGDAVEMDEKGTHQEKTSEN